MKKLLTLITILLLFISCIKEEQKNKQQKDVYKPDTSVAFNYLNFDDPKLGVELKKAIMENDTILYKKYYAIYSKSGHIKEFLYYAILMAEKNNYKTAYLHIAEAFDMRLDDPLITKYKFESKFSSYNLLKAYEMGDKNAKQSVKYIYLEKGKPIPKSSSIYCSK